MKSKNLNFFKIKKFLLKKGYKIQKNSSSINFKNYKSLISTVFASFILILLFGIMPSIVSISSKFLSSPSIVENNSKLNFEKVLAENNNRKKEETKEVNLNNKDKIGRNDPCHCGSGLKYKKCGMLDKCIKNS